MGVQLNIKDEGTVRLARDLAAELGENITETIRRALEERAAGVKAAQRGKSERLMAIGREASKLWRPEFDGVELSTRHGELLYDENGLPK